MTTSDTISTAERLKLHFSSRVTNQVRQTLDLWRLLPDRQWAKELVEEFTSNVEKLLRFAQRFEAERHEKLARDILSILAQIAPNSPPDSQQLERLTTLILSLNKTALRHTDNDQEHVLVPVKRPVYLVMSDESIAKATADQMQYFGLRPEVLCQEEDFIKALELRHPAALVLDINFTGPLAGIAWAKRIQESRETPLPILFTYPGQQPDLRERLDMLRQGSIGIYNENDAHALIGHIEAILDTTPEAPYKILIIDDSRAQSMHTANVLNKAGMLTLSVNDPLEVLNTIPMFSPDLILMDMYMPNCNGMELAKVIRQQREYINLPIIYLSGEEDRERQLAAMSEGGDDFLTKPVEPTHLLATLRNRVTRARQLHNLIARDSLTGLLNHTHILGALQEQMRRIDVPVTFVMVDIDHFKQVNDTYGHPIGDRVIRNLSLFLRQRLRKSDPIGRYGGEEFAVILPDATEKQAIKVMDDIRQNFANLIHDGDALKATFSCGLAEWRGESLSELVAIADQALYKAKHQGRNQVVGASQLDSCDHK